MSTEKDTYQKSGTSVVFQKEIKQCRECPHCLIVPDPDPNDWFNDDDEKALCKESDKVQAIEMAPALAVQKMIESGLTPEMVVQYKTVDQLTGIAEASAQMFEHVHLGQVTVYGNENTAGNFMAKTAENLNPAFDLLRSIPFADTLKSVLGKKELEEKKAETTEFEEVK